MVRQNIEPIIFRSFSKILIEREGRVTLSLVPYLFYLLIEWVAKEQDQTCLRIIQKQHILPKQASLDRFRKMS